MSKNYRYTLIGLGILFIIFLLWFFSNILVYIIISAVLALVGHPIVSLLGKIHIRQYKMPVAIRAFFAILAMYAVFIGFFWIFIPIVAREASALSNIDADTLISQIQVPLQKAQALYDKYQIRDTNSPGFEEIIAGKIRHVLDVKILSDIISELAQVLGNLFIALFSITFITFFFLQDQGMVTEAIILLVPNKHGKAVRRALASITRLLIRYFIGIGGQLTGILLLVTIGMTIIGLDFKQSLLIGLTAAVMNIIPYLGPLIGSGLGILMGLAFHLDMGIVNLLPQVGYMVIVYLVVHTIDNFIFQPFIFGSSVNAHPLEEALTSCDEKEESFIIGGGMVYKQFLPHARKLYITRLHKDFEGDTFFPEINFDEWDELERRKFLPDEKNDFSYSFIIYKRKN